ncbi:protein kinase [Candidatus Uabimicrobium sp. HlEnr_7]|uniref:protein kinase domain-containing protein n=1 Tax=Candidatus Uabimicrobium helgolandensis TaxID=3095367 RepID=UPI003557134E
MNEFEDTWSDAENNLLFSKVTLSNYKLIEKIGQGGMGAVYKAQQLSPQRIVAIKTIKTSSNMRRFEREMQIASQLNHPNIAKVYNAGVENNQKYLVMEYISGQPLSDYLKETTVSLEKKLEVFVKICEILSYAHQKEIIHRDLKPNNIIMNEKNEPVLIDFGIAKYTYNRKFDLTKTGEILGTPNYMAPEQIVGKSSNVGYSTDIYSLGAIFYEMLCNKRMAIGSRPLNVLFQIMQGEFTSPRKINPQIDKSLELIWKKSTAHKPKNRYQKVSDLQLDLQNFISGKKIRASYLKETLLVSFFCTLISVALYFSSSQNTNTIELSKHELALEKKFKTTIYNIKNNIPVEVEQLSKSHFSDIHQINIVKTFYNEGQYGKALVMINQISKESHYYLESIYYKGLISYHEERYGDAQKQFEFLILKNDKNLKYHYYLGCVYFKQRSFRKSLFHLLKVEKAFNDDITLVESIAKIYSEMKNKKKAIEYLEECIRLSPGNAKYFTMLGKIEIQEKNYYKAFAHLKKALYTGNFIEALTLMHEIPYREPRLRRWCYQSILHKCVSEKEGKYPDLFTNKWQEIENRYRQDYLSYQEAIKKAKGTIESLLRPINDERVKNTIQEALFSLRYSESFDREINNIFINKTLPETTIDFFNKIAKKIREKKRQEQLRVTYYKLAFMHRNKSWNESSFESSDFLINALLEEKDVFLKYLLAEGYLQIFNFKSIIEIANDHNKDVITRIICCAVLRKNYLATKIDVFQSLVDIKFTFVDNKEFLETLIAQAMFVPHYVKRIDTFQRPVPVQKLPFPAAEKKLLEYLIKQESSKVSLSAALSFRGLIGFNKVIPDEIENIIYKAMDNKDTILSNYAHFMFWISNSPVNGNKYLDKFREALKNPNHRIKEIALSQIQLFRDRIPIIMPEIENCMKSDSIRVRFRAIFAWVFAQRNNQVIFDDPLYIKIRKQLTPLEHSAIITFTFYKFFSLKNINQNAIMNTMNFLNVLKKKLHTLPDTSQCMISYVLSLAQMHPSLQQLEKMNDSLLAYFIYQLHQQVNPGKKFTYLPFLNPKKPVEKRHLAKKFLSNKNPKVRMFATSSYVAFSSEEERKRLFNKALKTKDTYFRKGVALGFYFALQNAWIANKEKPSLSFQDLFGDKSVDLVLAEKFERLDNFVHRISTQSPQKFDKYKTWIKNALRLAPEESEYLYVHTLFFPQKSTEQIKKAIKFNKKHYENSFKHVYFLQFLKVSANQDKLKRSQLKERQEIPSSLLVNFANIFDDLEMYDKALDFHEKYFLAKTKQNSPFTEILSVHSEMVYYHIKNNDIKTAKILLQYLYELYRRNKSYSKNISKKTFLRELQGKNPKIKISW